MSANPTPGNKRGGLANIVEKALGSIAKAGSSAINAVATHGQKVTEKGLVFAATPASDFICGTQQLASMNVHVFTTGEGSPYGLALVPVVKVSSRTALAEKWHDLIDIDAGRIATGKATIQEVGNDIFRFILDVASGRKRTWAEHWGLGNALIPTVTVLGLAFGSLLSGAVMTETIFAWPGLGRYAYQSAVSNDFPSIMGVTFVIALMYIAVNLAVDMVYAMLDPQIRYS